MNKKTKSLNPIVTVILIVIVAIVMFFCFLSATFVVNNNEFVVVKEFGKVVRVIEEPGFNWKNAFTQNIDRLSRKIQVYDLPPSDIITNDKKTMKVDSYVTYTIDDPLVFIQTLSNVDEAERRIDASVYNAIKNTMGQYDQNTIIQERNGAISEKVSNIVSESLSIYGIKSHDVKVKTFDLPDENKQAVYNRMISERKQIAAQYSAEGKEQASKIQNEANMEARTIISESKAKAEKIMAEGESEYMRILAEAYSGPERVEFYEFTRSLDALKISMKGDKTLVLPIDSPLTKWFVGY